MQLHTLQSQKNGSEANVDVKDAFAASEDTIEAFKQEHVVKHLCALETKYHWCARWLHGLKAGKSKY
jgi:hypothetical protein